jgi:hypothetical protein
MINRATGLGTIKGDPTAALGIATKQYVDNAIISGGSGAQYVQKIGDTMTGPLVLPGLTIRSAAAADILFHNNAFSRWIVRGFTNFEVRRYNDAGVDQGVALSIDRATGAVNAPVSLSTQVLNVTTATVTNLNGTNSTFAEPVVLNKGHKGDDNGILRFRGASNEIWWDLNLSNAFRKMFDTSNSPFSAAGYVKFANGFVLQWGQVGGGLGKFDVVFPIVFPNTCLAAVPVIVTGTSGISAEQSVITTVQWVGQDRFAVETRYINAGGAVGWATQPVMYIAVGY